MKYKMRFTINRAEAYQVANFYLKDARKMIRRAIDWRKNDRLAPEGYKDYLRWAKEAAAESRKWHHKLGMHFGRRALAEILAERKLAA